MTTLTEALAPWPDPAPLVANLERSGGGWSVFAQLLRAAHGIRPGDATAKMDRDTVLAICSAWGFADVEPLVAWAERLDLGGRPLALPPPVEIGGMTKVSHDYLRDKVQRARGYQATQDVRWYQTDAEYRLLDEASLEVIRQRTPSRFLPYRATTMDCDDHQRALMGWLAQHGLGNVSIGTANLKIYRQGNLIGAHAMCVAVWTSGAMLLEPATGRLHEFDDKRVGNFLLADEVRVFEIGF